MAASKNICPIPEMEVWHIVDDMVRELSLAQLRAFLVVVEERNITRAAARLLIAQPPLSQQLSRLERDLSCRLLERSPKGVEPTPAGEVLAREARDLLELHDRIRPQVEAAAAGRSGRLAVGSVPVACAGVAPLLLHAFHQRYPGLDVTLHELDNLDLYSAVEQHRVDLGLSRVAPHDHSLRTERLLVERGLMAVPADHPSVSSRARLADFATEDFVLYSRQLGPHHFDEFVARCHAAGFTPRVASECRTVNSQLALIAAGQGVGFVTSTAEHHPTPGVELVEVADLDMQIPLLLTWDPTAIVPARDRLIEVARDWSASRDATDASPTDTSGLP